MITMSEKTLRELIERINGQIVRSCNSVDDVHFDLLAETKQALERELTSMTTRWEKGQRILVECVVKKVATVTTNWPVQVELDTGASETIDVQGNVHYSAIKG